MSREGTTERTVQGGQSKSEGGPAVATWWMICRSGTGGFEVMTLRRCGGEALALFGHAEEAELFLRSLGTEVSGGWRIRESRCGEVASVLYGPCARVERVTLDPPPTMPTSWAVALASMERDDFLAHLLAREGADQGFGRRARGNAAGTRRNLRPASPLQEGSACRKTVWRKDRKRTWVTREERGL